MSTGILVACVPTIGPVLFPSRFGAGAKARYQYRDNWRTPYKESSGRTPLRGPLSDGFQQRSFRTLEEGDVELKATLQTEMGYRAHAGSADVSDEPGCYIDANKIGVRKDLHVFDTPNEV